MDGRDLSGRWTGLFTETPQGTLLDFTEEVTVKKTVMKPFAALYLRKQQSRYAADLKKKLER